MFSLTLVWVEGGLKVNSTGAYRVIRGLGHAVLPPLKLLQGFCDKYSLWLDLDLKCIQVSNTQQKS